MQDTNTTQTFSTRFDPNDVAARLICADGRIWDELHDVGTALAIADARAAYSEATEYSSELEGLATKHPSQGVEIYLAAARATRDDARRNLTAVVRELA